MSSHIYRTCYGVCDLYQLVLLKVWPLRQSQTPECQSFSGKQRH